MSAAGRAAAPAGVRRGAPADGDRYYEFDRPEVRALVPPGARRVLDVGCGGGALGAALRDERPGVEVVGVELQEDAARRAAARLDRVIVADLDAPDPLPADAGRFDAIVLADVLEHLRDPGRLLRDLAPALAPGASLVVSVPNVKHWSVVLPLLVHDRFAYTDAGLLDRTHVHLFTLEELGRMLQGHGYTVSEVGVVSDPVPDAARPLADAAVALGAAADETVARLSAYQYLAVAVRA